MGVVKTQQIRFHAKHKVLGEFSVWSSDFSGGWRTERRRRPEGMGKGYRDGVIVAVSIKLKRASSVQEVNSLDTKSPLLRLSPMAGDGDRI